MGECYAVESEVAKTNHFNVLRFGRYVSLDTLELSLF